MHAIVDANYELYALNEHVPSMLDGRLTIIYPSELNSWGGVKEIINVESELIYFDAGVYVTRYIDPYTGVNVRPVYKLATPYPS